MSMCRAVSWVGKEHFLLWPMCCLDKILLPFALLHSVLQGQPCLLFQVSLDFLFPKFHHMAFQSHIIKRTTFCDVSSRWCSSLQRLSTSASLAKGLRYSLGLLWCWMICLGNEPKSLLRLHSSTTLWTLVDYEGCCNSSKGVLPFCSSGYNGQRFVKLPWTIIFLFAFLLLCELKWTKIYFSWWIKMDINGPI